MGREQVLEVGVEARQPLRLLRAEKLGSRALREVDVVSKMAGAGGVAIRRRVQMLLRVLAHRLEQAIATGVRVVHDERLLDQARENVQHVALPELAARADRL